MNCLWLVWAFVVIYVMSMPESPQETIPFSVRIEGAIEPTRLPALLEALGSLCSGQLVVNVHVGDRPEAESSDEAGALETVSKADFYEHWGKGAGHTWGHLKRLAQDNEDFPLQPTDEPHVIEGNINEAMQWLLLNRPTLTALIVLERIQRARRKQVTAP